MRFPFLNPVSSYISSYISSPISSHLHRVSFLAAGAIVFSLGSCTTPEGTIPKAESPNSAESPAVVTSETTSEEGLQVVTTFLPMTQFTTAVAGDRAEVIQLLPTGVGPHDYQAKPGDVQSLATADVLVKNGLEMEFFLEGLIKNAENPNLLVIDSSEGIETIASNEDHHHEEGKDHGEDHHHGEGEDHEEDHHHEEGEAHEKDHHHGEFNPHIWLDPKRAIEQVENIRDGLIAADPEGEAEYTANTAAFIAELKALDAEITGKLAPFAGKTFVVFHDFAPYFANSYGLQAEILVDIPEENPTPEDVRRVMQTVQSKGLKTILAEPQSGQQSFETIANDLNIKISIFDPLETGGAEAIQPSYYLRTMRQNAENLLIGFQ